MLKNSIPLLGLASLIALPVFGLSACTETETSTETDAGTQAPDASEQPDAGGGDDAGEETDGGFFTGPIAPECDEPNCAQVEVDALLECKDVDSQDYTITSRFSGKTDGVSCGVEDTSEDGSSHDVWFHFQPPQDTEGYNINGIRFWLKDYKGPGTYELESADTGDYRNMGIYIQGATAGSQADEKTAWAKDELCKPSPCQATVLEGSEQVKHDPSGVQSFRLRVQVTCSDGGELFTHPDCQNNSRCTIKGEPTLKFDVVCAH